MEKKYCTSYNGMLHGADYNPEQWLTYPGIIDEDIRLMKEAHCNVVALGIFSWSFLEPEEGIYNFEYFDEIIQKLTDNDIKIILATPSGARPRWLAEKYPEVLRVFAANKGRDIYGGRHNHCFTSPIYREKVGNINRRLAERYKDNKNIIMWHLSNEYGGECHCDLCQNAFREYLKKKYDNDLDKLNHAWWTGFWSHTVTDWTQIHSPVDGGEGNSVMPGLYIDWKEFVTYQTADFMNYEAKAVKEFTPDIPVTANFMGPYQSLDYNYMQKFVDVISWDSYPTWHSEKKDRGDVFEGYSIAFAHDLHRGLKNAPFLLMESTPSLTNWMEINKLKKPKMHKLSSIQAIAHGSDSVQYFQWRKGRGGSEKFHGAVIDHNGKGEGRVFEDVKNLGITLEKLQEVAGSMVRSDVAVVYDFKNRWAIDNAQGFVRDDKKYKRTCINHYKELWKRGINADVIGPDVDFGKYKLLILPMLYSLSEETIDRIEKYVASGGTVVSTYMTGYANETDLCYLGGFPGGKLKDVFGLVADEIDTLYPTDSNIIEYNGKDYKVVDYCELITPTTAKTLGVYKEDFYAGKAVILENCYKDGKAYYIGSRDTGEFLDAFYEELLNKLNISGFDMTLGVTAHTRENDDATYLFIENYNDIDGEITLEKEYVDMETGENVSGVLELKAYDSIILKEK